MTQIVTPDSKILDAFWTHAINAAQLNPAEAFAAQDDLLSLRPAAFAFGDTAQMADRLCDLVLTGKKTATTSYGPAYLVEGEEYPKVGDLSILCDGKGIPRALLRNAKVEIFPFNQVPAKVALCEGEYPDTFTESEVHAQWKTEHEDFFRKEFALIGGDFVPTDDVIVEYLEVLYKTAN